MEKKKASVSGASNSRAAAATNSPRGLANAAARHVEKGKATPRGIGVATAKQAEKRTRR
jgi:hypothetical protein